MKNYAELASRLRMAALATQTFPTLRGRRLRAEQEQMLNEAAEALENVGTELATAHRDALRQTDEASRFFVRAEDAEREAEVLRDRIGGRQVASK